jgi:hypothetical protein
LEHRNLHGIVTVAGDIGSYIPESLADQPCQGDPDIEISLKTDKSKPGFVEIAPGLRLWNDERMAVSTLNVLGLEASWGIQNLIGKPTRVFADRTYRLLSKHLLAQPISTVFPAHAFIQMVVHIKLMQTGHTFVVGGCVHHPGGATVISSMGGMGKTTLIEHLVARGDCVFMSDDMVIVDPKGSIFAYPKRIRRRGPGLGPLRIERYVAPEKSIAKGNGIQDRSMARDVVLLERGNRTQLSGVSKEEALRKILAINRKLLPYHMERSVLAYSYMSSSFDLGEIMQREKGIIASFLEHAGTCQVLTARPSDLQRTMKLLRDIIGGG